MKKETIETIKHSLFTLSAIVMTIKLIVQGHLIGVVVMLLLSFAIRACIAYFEATQDERLAKKWANILKESRQHRIVVDDVWRCKLHNNSFLRFGELAIIDTIEDDTITVTVAAMAVMGFSRANFLQCYERTLLKRADVGFAGRAPKITKSTFSL